MSIEERFTLFLCWMTLGVMTIFGVLYAETLLPAL